MVKTTARIVGLVASLALAPLAPLPFAAPAQAAPVGAGFTVTPGDLAFILKQIKIAEHHAATYTAQNPCGTLVGPGPNQIPSPLVSYGLRTVDGSCNNLIAGREAFGAADRIFPRLSTAEFRDADPVPAGFPGENTRTSYKQTSGYVFDSEPRTISNLIVDQTSANPAAVAAAGHPVRTQGNEGVVPCTTDPTDTTPGVPSGCVPTGQTLPIPNVTTDVGLSPPYNALFTIFGQFFDHGLDLTTKDGGTVFVPLRPDDPLYVPGSHSNFMVLTRAQNEPGPDGVLGTGDDVQEATNTDSPWVDQSQTYTSHPSHQVFVREYTMNPQGRPVSTGKLLASADGGMATWGLVKQQAADMLGLRLEDQDVLNVPLLAVDPYGTFIPGPARGLPQYVTGHGLVEGNLASPVPVPADARRVADCAPGVSCNEGFVVDIAHNAFPGLYDDDGNPGTPKVPMTPDPDHTITGAGDLQPVGTYDDEMLDAHFCAGDGRVNENIALSTIHQIFHSEHDRLVGDIKRVLTDDAASTDTGAAALGEWKLANGAAGWNGERLFQAARFVTEMEYQHIVFEEFARKIAPSINPFEPFAFTQEDLDPAITAEFAQAVYRFGHSMLTDTIDRVNADGSHNDIALLDAFLNPPAYTQATPGGPSGALTSEQAAGSVVMGLSDEVGSELDEFVGDTLRNNLLGLPLDLATINIARARETGIPPLNVVRRQIWQATNDAQLRPYSSWVDFGMAMKHPESLVNFVAAYGQHPSVTGEDTVVGKRTAAQLLVDPPLDADPATIPADAADFMNGTGTWAGRETGLNEIDLWVGGLAERTNLFGGLLGSTFNYVFENQLTDLQNGDRFYYLGRTQGMNLLSQLESNSFAELIMRNTDAHTLKADAFSTADCKFELGNLSGTTAGFAASGNRIADDPASECDEGALLVRMPDGTIRYRERNTVDPAGLNGQSVYDGTAGRDRVWGGVDNDTFWGNEGADVIEGNDGADVALGGAGDDIVTDSAGDDVLKGGPGDDALDGGPGLDIIEGGDGKDFTNGGANANETFAGPGDDFVIAGQGADAVLGNEGDDWEEAGDQPDLLQGDAGNLFFLDDGTRPGSDILIGQGGDDDYDMEGGDDIGVSGPGIEKVAGGAGYDWEIGLGDPQPQRQDLSLKLIGLDALTVDLRDRYSEVEALSGWKGDDVLVGDDLVPAQVGGAGFVGCDALDQRGVDRIRGLGVILPALDSPADSVAALSAAGSCPLRGPVWGAGNILLGGAGSDTLEGRGGDDIIDGDRFLSVRLSVRTNAADPSTEIGSASPAGPGQSAMNSQYLRDANGNLTGPTLQHDVFDGTVDPGDIVAVREILSASNAGDVDTAVFTGPRSSYTCVIAGNAPVPCPTALPAGPRVRVIHTPVSAVVGGGGGGGAEDPAGGAVTPTTGDGTDRLRNVERLVFSDTVPPEVRTMGQPIPGDRRATVTWTLPDTLLTDAVVLRSEVRVVDATGAQVGALRELAGEGTSLVVTGLTNGETYRFQVRSVNEFGTGPFSELSAPVTPAVTTATAPAAPTVDGASAGIGRARLTWTASADDGGSDVTGFVVRTLDASGAEVATRVTGPAATGATVRGLTNGETYRLQVAAVNAVGTGAWSVRSRPVTPRTTSPGAPTIQTVRAGDGLAVARWTAPFAGGSAITGYRLWVRDASGRRVGPVRTTAADSRHLRVRGLTNGVAYWLQAAAVNDVGTGRLSVPRMVRPLTTPDAPRTRAPRSGHRGGVVSATARWAPPASNGGAAVTGYVVTALRIGPHGVRRRLASPVLPATVRAYRFRLPRGRYRFVVEAANRMGRGDRSTRSALVRAR